MRNFLPKTMTICHLLQKKKNTKKSEDRCGCGQEQYTICFLNITLPSTMLVIIFNEAKMSN